MCRTRRDTLVSHPSTSTRRHTTTNSSTSLPNPVSTSTLISTSTTSTSSSSTTTSLSTLRLSLSDNPTLYPFSEISTSIRSKPPWRSTLRGKQVLITHLPFNGDPSTLPSRLSALSKSHHTSLLPLLGASLAADDSLYLIYASIPAATLRDCLRNPKNPNFTPLSTWISRIQIAADIADGLQYIHVHSNTIHNRITSSAVLVTDPTLRAKICHFGAADLAGEDRGTKIEGTRGYIAPEVIAGGRISQKSDVFAFGVVILEIVSGREPVRYKMSGSGSGSGSGGEGYEREAVVETAREAIGTEDEDGAAAEEAEERRWRVRRWVDGRLRDSFPVEVAERLIRVALRCVEEERFMRPEMTWVAGIVSGLLLESRVWEETVRLPTDFSVTIAPR